MGFTFLWDKNTIKFLYPYFSAFICIKTGNNTYLLSIIEDLRGINKASYLPLRYDAL